jgi:putative ABC transport system permease protein
MQVQTSGHRFDDDSTTNRFFSQALEAVRRAPGVRAAALTSQLPLSGDVDRYGVHFDPSPSDDPGEVLGTFRYAVSPGYIETMGIPLRRGRSLDERDRAGAPRVALISESMAKRRLPGLDPIGRRLRIGDGPSYAIVGVVGDVRQLSLALTESDAVYVTASQWRFADDAMSLVVRPRGGGSVAPGVRRAIWSVDKDRPIVRVATMGDLVAASGAARRFTLILFEAFALTALALAAAGIYGVLAGSVVERTREIGVRSALGASRRDILALVIRQGMALTGLGVAIGVAGAALATQAIVAMLFGVSRLDPATYLGVIGLLAGVAMTACAVPAWRAARVDPAGTLRSE